MDWMLQPGVFSKWCECMNYCCLQLATETWQVRQDERLQSYRTVKVFTYCWYKWSDWWHGVKIHTHMLFFRYSFITYIPSVSWFYVNCYQYDACIMMFECHDNCFWIWNLNHVYKVSSAINKLEALEWYWNVQCFVSPFKQFSPKSVFIVSLHEF